MNYTAVEIRNLQNVRAWANELLGLDYIEYQLNDCKENPYLYPDGFYENTKILPEVSRLRLKRIESELGEELVAELRKYVQRE